MPTLRWAMALMRFSTSEFQAEFDAVSEKARHQPVVITKDGQDALVVISATEWARLKRRDRRVGPTSDLPEAWIEAVLNAGQTANFS